MLPAYPGVFLSENTDLDDGDKIVLPDFVLRKIMHDVGTKRNLPNPAIFRITNEVTGKRSHCGVLEFNPAQKAFLPNWMMDNLLLQPGDQATFTLIEDYPKLNYISLKPTSSKFFENVENPKYTLEHALRKFTVLTLGDTFVLKLLGDEYEFQVNKIGTCSEAADFGCLINTDLNVNIEASVPTSQVVAPGEKETKGIVREKKPVYYKLNLSQRKENEGIKVILISKNGESDVYLSKSIAKPNANDNDWEDLSVDEEKSIILTNLENVKWLYLGIHTISEFSEFTLKLELYKTEKIQQGNSKKEENVTKGSFYVSDTNSDTEKCPNCSILIKKSNFSMHLMRCQRLNWMCEQCGKVVLKTEKMSHAHCPQCAHEIKPKNIQKHILIKHKPIICDCGLKVQPSNLKEHKKNCIMGVKKCKYCECPQKTKDLEDHESYCGSRTMNCVFCDQLVRLNSMQIHRAAEHGINPNSKKSDEERIEEIMINKAIEESIEHHETMNQESSGQKCPYCNTVVSRDEDIGLHMLSCFNK